MHDDHSYSSSTEKLKNWSMEEGYTPGVGLDSYPYRALKSGEKTGFSITLRMNESNFDYLCKGPVQGFKILLHNPIEFPQPSKYYYLLPMETEITFSIEPKTLVTSENLQTYAPEQRFCYYSRERYLKFFKFYTQKNCEYECLTNYTLNQCGCVRFTMPRDKDTHVCGIEKIKCYENAEENLLLDELSEAKNSPSNICDCKPECFSIDYDTEITKATFDVEAQMKATESFTMEMSE